MKPISKQSITDYTKVFMRLIKGASNPKEVLERAQKTKAKNTWFVRRAAVLYMCKLREHLATKALDAELAPNGILALPQSLLDEIYKTFTEAPPLAERKPRHSKRQDMRQLPDNWCEQIWDEPGLAKHRLPYSVSALTGCRPSELKKGVWIACKSSPPELSFVIQGAKITDKSGQPSRAMKFEVTPGQNRFIDSIVAAWKSGRRNEQGFLVISIQSEKSFSAAITRASLRLGLGGKRGLSAYCLRHAFASKLKQSQKSREEIAKGLGHQSEKTQTCYGQARMTGGGVVVPQGIAAKNTVRPLKAKDVATRLHSSKNSPRKAH